MIELLGVSVSRRGRGWLLHRVCATLETGELTVVVSSDRAERAALLDTMAGRRVPEEGRAWISRVPVMAESLGRVRRLCGDIDPSAELVGHRSLFWNALAPATGPRTLGRLLRLPRRREREAVMLALERVGLRGRADERAGSLTPFDRLRFLVARALARRPRNLIVREPDTVIGPSEIGAVLALLRLLARSEHLSIVVSLADWEPSRSFADRVLVLGEGLLLFDGTVQAMEAPRAAWRAEALRR